MRRSRTREIEDLIGGDPDEFREKSPQSSKSIPKELTTTAAAEFFGVDGGGGRLI